MLTDMTLSNFKADKGKRIELWDKNGLGIRIGKKWVWFLKYTFVGRSRRMNLGEYPAMSLKAARKEAANAALDIQNGIDPGTKKMEANAEYKAAPTFADIIKELWDRELKDKKSGAETRRLIEKDVVPSWGKKKVAEIKRRDIVLLLDRIRERAPITANRVHGALSRLFNFAAERGVIEDSPCIRIRKSPEKGRSRVLTDEEIRQVWEALDLNNMAVDAYRLTKLALKLIMLSGQRPGEVCGMTWAEIDQEGYWNIPAARMKNGEPHRVPLTGMAMEIVEQARPYSGESCFVFKSTHRAGDAPMTAHALSRALWRHWQAIGIKERFTPHDLRRTVRTRMAELGVTDVVAERVLGHKLQGIMAVYNRHGYDQEKRQALEQWERKLRRIVGIEEQGLDKVIEIRRQHV